MGRIKSTLVLMLAGVLALATACSSGDSEGDDGLTKMRIAATSVDSLPFMAILQVAQEKGWFEDEGLDVSFISGSGGGNTLRTLTTGDADLAIAGGPAVVTATQQSNGQIKLIGSWFQVNDFYFLGTDKSTDPEKAKLGVTGAGSTTQLLANYLKEEKLPDVEIVELGGGMGDAWAAARSGAIDAGWAMHPFITDKVENEGGVEIMATRDLIGDFPADLVATSASYADKEADALEAFFRAADKANDYVVNDTDAAAADLSPILGIDTELLAAGIKETPELAKAYSLTVDKSALETLSAMMVTNGLIDEPVDWAELLDQSYLPDDAKADF